MPVVQQSQMINLTFAPAAVTSYVAERSDELYARYGAEKNNEQIGDLQGDDLMLVELDYAMNSKRVQLTIRYSLIVCCSDQSSALTMHRASP